MSKIKNQKQLNKDDLNDALKCQNDSRKSLLDVMQSLGEATEPVEDVDSAGDIQVFLQDLKESLEICNKNIAVLNKLIKEIDNTHIWNDDSQIESEAKAEDYYSSISNSNYISSVSPINNEISQNFKENTLIISETKGSVILPYELSKIQRELEYSNNKYSSIDEIITKQYTLPITLYKNPFISRFRESYRLMRNKEKSSIKDAFNLGLEMMFNYNLHPAIITACRNLDELDIFLDYLDSGETDKFKIFKIQFDVLPAIVKVKHKI